jgi:hypothetical protein
LDARGDGLALTPVTVEGSVSQQHRRIRLRRRRAIQRVRPGYGCLGLLLAMCFSVLFLGLVAVMMDDYPWWQIVLMIAVLWSVLAFALTLILERIPNVAGPGGPNRLVAMLGLCYACGYDLADLHPEADGCTVCPECGAAWRLNVRGLAT